MFRESVDLASRRRLGFACIGQSMASVCLCVWAGVDVLVSEVRRPGAISMSRETRRRISRESSISELPSLSLS